MGSGNESESYIEKEKMIMTTTDSIYLKLIKNGNNMTEGEKEKLKEFD
jgi:hypothetical protein